LVYTTQEEGGVRKEKERSKEISVKQENGKEKKKKPNHQGVRAIATARGDVKMRFEMLCEGREKYVVCGRFVCRSA
jgi:hypothetical protein